MQKLRIILLIALFMVSWSLPGQEKPGKRITFWAQDAGTPAQRFELAKRTTPELITFVRRLPKGADLHNHLSGAVYSDFVLDEAEKAGLYYNLESHLFQVKTSAGNGEVNIGEHLITIAQLKNNPLYLAEFLDRASMRGWFPNTANGHDKFFNSFVSISSYRKYKENSEYGFIAEVIKRNRYQQVQYLELMTGCIPGEVEDRFRAALDDLTGWNDKEWQYLSGSILEKKLGEVLDKAYQKIEPLVVQREIKALINRYLDERDRGVQRLLGISRLVAGDEGELVIRYIPQVKRTGDLESVFFDVLLGMVAIKSDGRVVGLDIVAPEDAPVSRVDFEKHMIIIDYLWRKFNQPKITLHAGELVLRESPVEAMQDRIRRSIEKGHALRIGHGVSIAWEKDTVGLLEMMRDKKILVEICLTSNESILDVKEHDHPFEMYRRAGVPVSINTDDEGISRSNLTMEYVKAIQRYDLSYEEVKEIVRNSLEYSFLPGESLFIGHDYTVMRPGFEGIHEREWQPGKKAKKQMVASPKLKRQVILERAWVVFEISLLNGFRE